VMLAFEVTCLAQPCKVLKALGVSVNTLRGYDTHARFGEISAQIGSVSLRITPRRDKSTVVIA
jgi:hypothetical protein